MVVQLNGKETALSSGTTVLELLQARKVNPQVVAIAINGDVLEPSDFKTTVLKEGDDLELVFHIGGGNGT